MLLIIADSITSALKNGDDDNTRFFGFRYFQLFGRYPIFIGRAFADPAYLIVANKKLRDNTDWVGALYLGTINQFTFKYSVIFSSFNPLGRIIFEVADKI